MSDDTRNNDHDAADVDPVVAARERDIEELASVLIDEFAAVTRAARRLRIASDEAKSLDPADLFAILAKLRTGRAVDDLTGAFVDLKEQEARNARELLDELDRAELESLVGDDLDDDEDDLDDDLDDLDDEDFDDEDDDFEGFDDTEFDDDELGVDDFGEFLDPDPTAEGR